MVRYRVRVGEMWGGVGGDWVRVGDRVKVGRGQGDCEMVGVQLLKQHSWLSSNPEGQPSPKFSSQAQPDIQGKN